MKMNPISCGRYIKNNSTDHIDVKRALEQLPVMPCDIFPVPSYVPLRNVSSNRTDVKGALRGGDELTPIQI